MIKRFNTLNPVIKIILSITILIAVGFLLTKITTFFLDRQVNEEDLAYVDWYNETSSEMNDIINEAQFIYEEIERTPDTYIDLTSYMMMKDNLSDLTDEIINYPKPKNRILKKAHKLYIKESIYALQAMKGLDEFVDSRQYFSTGPSDYLANILNANSSGMQAGSLVYDFRDINDAW
ncbi:hypothetical protein [Niallia endozanthoxylica]|uniref:Uncharacterized protein n=1 Tax=Niallia endozanthoxylica TaxID=2036016 RepID=A0A5J5HRD2_9BACI|nr:hypothetical protein [Niallia endozanthoxylica]KAA9022298.1 hypothetical protein F4V44_15640 [Niallia endozanthoxylica]